MLIGIFITLNLLLAIFLRVTYIRGLIDDWNNNLNIYLRKLETTPIYYRERSVEYVQSRFLNPWYYWYRLDCWTIERIIVDDYLIKDVKNVAQDRYIM